MQRQVSLTLGTHRTFCKVVTQPNVPFNCLSYGHWTPKVAENLGRAVQPVLLCDLHLADRIKLLIGSHYIFFFFFFAIQTPAGKVDRDERKGPLL